MTNVRDISLVLTVKYDPPQTFFLISWWRSEFDWLIRVK